MRPTAYINGQVLRDRGFESGMAVVVEDSIIVGVIPGDDLVKGEYDLIDLNGHSLLPGFIDTQVNGGGGVLFNDSTDLDGINTIVKAHEQFGTTGLLLTLISDELDVVQNGISAVNAAIKEGIPGVLGIHIEGPFLNAEKRGIHDACKIRSLTTDIVRELEPVNGGCSVMTVAPETMNPALIAELKEKGFIVSAGHTNATYADVSTAIEHGVTGFTHLFNAMSQLGAREPGVVGAALDHDNTWCGIIADGFHVSPASIRTAYRCKGPERLMLVTDAMPPVGSDENQFLLMGNRITAENGVCINANGTFAGAALDMASAVRNMMKFTDCSLAEASLMASTSPAAFLGLQHQTGSIKEGLRADFVVLDAQMNVVKTVNGGSVTFN